MLAARYFDGRSAASASVTLAIAGDRVRVIGETVARDEPVGAITISERIGRSPRFVRFSDGAFCEVTDVDTLERLLTGARVGSSAVSQWETSGRLAIALAVLLIAVAGFGYWFGTPLAAKFLADRMPVTALDALSDQVLASLDAQVFDPSGTPEVRRGQITREFAAMHWPSTAGIPMRVEFRKSPVLGANALALPSGLIVVTDELVAIAQNDAEILAVLAHEAGHVQERHGMRSIIQSSFTSLLVTWIVGDVGSLIAIAPTALLNARYSRNLERDADRYAIDALDANGSSAHRLADILERMEHARDDDGHGMPSVMSYMSTHPATEERLRTLRREK